MLKLLLGLLLFLGQSVFAYGWCEATFEMNFSSPPDRSPMPRERFVLRSLGVSPTHLQSERLSLTELLPPQSVAVAMEPHFTKFLEHWGLKYISQSQLEADLARSQQGEDTRAARGYVVDLARLEVQNRRLRESSIGRLGTSQSDIQWSELPSSHPQRYSPQEFFDSLRDGKILVASRGETFVHDRLAEHFLGTIALPPSLRAGLIDAARLIRRVHLASIELSQREPAYRPLTKLIAQQILFPSELWDQGTNRSAAAFYSRVQVQNMFGARQVVSFSQINSGEFEEQLFQAYRDVRALFYDQITTNLLKAVRTAGLSIEERPLARIIKSELEAFERAKPSDESLQSYARWLSAVIASGGYPPARSQNSEIALNPNLSAETLSIESIEAEFDRWIQVAKTGNGLSDRSSKFKANRWNGFEQLDLHSALEGYFNLQIENPTLFETLNPKRLSILIEPGKLGISTAEATISTSAKRNAPVDLEDLLAERLLRRLPTELVFWNRQAGEELTVDINALRKETARRAYTILQLPID